MKNLGTEILPSIAGDAASPVNGQTWYNSTTGKLRKKENGNNLDIWDVDNYATTVTAAGTTTLTILSKRIQFFTGSTTQTVVMPDATTLILGWVFFIVNNSSGAVTVNMNGGSLLKTIAAGNAALFTVTAIGTAAGTWFIDYSSDPLKADLISPSFTTPTLGAALATSLLCSDKLGYTTGAGGTVTQATNKATTVIINELCGTITLNAASLAAGTTGATGVVSFTVTNSQVAATDVVIVQHDSGGTVGCYTITANTMAAGSFKITVRNNSGGALAEAIVIRFAVIKAVIT